MGLLAAEIKELRSLKKQFITGKVDSEQVKTQISIFDQIDKRVKSALMVMAIDARYSRRTLKKVNKLNLLSDGEAIDIEADSETEKIKCPEKDYKLITRAECLDYSGSHNGECKGCDHKVITQNLLLGAPNAN